MLLIPYGAPGLDADRVSTSGGIVQCPVPHVVIADSDRGPLRLNGGQYVFAEPPDLRAMTGASAQLDYLRDHLRGFCDLWRAPPKLFLDRYFEFVADRVARNENSLARKLAPFGTLYDYRDWSLSAPRPLPRALIRAPRRDGDFHAVDFAFWLGDRLLAVLLTGSGTPTKRAAARRAALDSSGAEILEISAGTLARDGAAYLNDILPAGDFAAFWTEEAVPSSPFKGSTLGDIVPP